MVDPITRALERSLELARVSRGEARQRLLTEHVLKYLACARRLLSLAAMDGRLEGVDRSLHDCILQVLRHRAGTDTREDDGR